MPRTIAFLLIVLTSSAAPALTIVHQGSSVAVIVVPDKATATERSSAIDLQRCLRRMSGATLPIVPEEQRPEGMCIDIGGTSAGTAVRNELLTRPDLNPQAAVIKVTDQHAVLVGRKWKFLADNDASTGYAVYTLLEQLGVRWLQPTPAWEIVPR